MAKPKRPASRTPAPKSTPARVSRAMKAVRPLRGSPGIGRRYEPGFRPPADRDPWVDEGEPEVNG